MRRWALADRELRCGFDFGRIQAGEPYQVIEGSMRTRIRCQAHAIGTPDLDALLAEREAAAVRDERRWTPIRTLAQDRRLPFDAKARAAGDD